MLTPGKPVLPLAVNSNVLLLHSLELLVIRVGDGREPGPVFAPGQALMHRGGAAIPGGRSTCRARIGLDRIRTNRI